MITAWEEVRPKERPANSALSFKIKKQNNKTIIIKNKNKWWGGGHVLFHLIWALFYQDSQSNVFTEIVNAISVDWPDLYFTVTFHYFYVISKQFSCEVVYYFSHL